MIVLDANAAFALSQGNEAVAKFRELISNDEKIIAPELIHAELTHTLIKYVKGKELPKEYMVYELEKILAIYDEFYPLDYLDREVMNEALRLGHSTYDMYYFILARRTGAALLTLDKRLNKLCLQNGVDCFFKTSIEDDPTGAGEWSVRVTNIDGADAQIKED